MKPKSMFFNNLTTAYRHLLKNSSFSLVNILGLTLGFMCFILIALYIHDELNFDRMHKDADRMFRVIQHEQKEDGEVRHVASVAARIGPESLKQFPEIIEECRLTEFGRITMGNDPTNRGYERIMVADSNFFQFFDFKLLQGESSTALSKPDGIVISEKLAVRYFSTNDALGKTIWINGNDWSITGVMQNLPANSHLQIDLLFSPASINKLYNGYTQFETTDWSTNSFATYVKIQPGTAVPEFENKLAQLVKQNYPANKVFNSTFTLQSLGDIHLYSSGMQDYQVNLSGFNPFYVYMFSAVAFLILLIAALNYMNLSTAAAFKRTKEIGTRKTLGAGKGSLVAQFIGEAVLLSLISLVLAVAVLQMFLPSINDFMTKNLSLFNLTADWGVYITIILLGGGILAAMYPAFIAARVSPILAIRKEIRFANRSIPVRKMLVLVQFVVSIIMISSTLIIYKQLRYMREKELGFNSENLITIDINSRVLRSQFEAVKNELARMPEVQQVTVSSRVPGEWKSFPIATVNLDEREAKSEMIFVGIDQDFVDTYQLELLEGRNFTSSPGDSSAVILTRMAAEQLGLSDPVGQSITIPSAAFGGSIVEFDNAFKASVIGVVEDFHFESFRKQMRPLIFAYYNNPIQSIDYYTLRLNTRNWDQTLSSIQKINSKFDPVNPVEYNFLDSKIEEFYKSDAKRGKIFLVFSGIIILIACMGLFALVSFSVENRKKEIGVRKVLGASAESIVSLLSKEFISLVVAAFIIATPLVILLMNNWLSEFAYHVDFGLGTFVISGIISVLIAFATISAKSIRAAVRNPVDSLRSE